MPSLILLHSCESDESAAANAAYLRRIAAEPHWVYDPRCPTSEAIQLLPYSAAGKALRNLAGGVETNRRDADRDGATDIVQVELVGFASQVASYDDQWYANLREFLVWLCTELGVPYTFPLPFVDNGNDVRLSLAEWVNPELTGIIGHQHAPENDHWDPGPLDVSRLASQVLTPASFQTPADPEDDDMSLAIHRPTARTGANNVADFDWLPEDGRVWRLSDGRAKVCSSVLVLRRTAESGNGAVRVFFPGKPGVDFQLAWGKPLVLAIPAEGMVSVIGENVSVHAREAWA